jgi:hypothetical protein
MLRQGRGGADAVAATVADALADALTVADAVAGIGGATGSPPLEAPGVQPSTVTAASVAATKRRRRLNTNSRSRPMGPSYLRAGGAVVLGKVTGGAW